MPSARSIASVSASYPITGLTSPLACIFKNVSMFKLILMCLTRTSLYVIQRKFHALCLGTNPLHKSVYATCHFELSVRNAEEELLFAARSPWRNALISTEQQYLHQSPRFYCRRAKLCLAELLRSMKSGVRKKSRPSFPTHFYDHEKRIFVSSACCIRAIRIVSLGHSQPASGVQPSAYT